ncbi:MAG: hemerythrin domain-containing protein [Bacteroidales bacterium]
MNETLPFHGRMPMADVIHADYKLIPVLARFGISFGFGNHTVEEVCQTNGIHPTFFLEIISSYRDRSYFPANRLRDFPAAMIIDYLARTHEYYLQVKIPAIQKQIEAMAGRASRGNADNVRLLRQFFSEYTEELLVHLSHEDDRIFPYVLRLEKALRDGRTEGDLLRKIREEPIAQFERNHDNVEEKLSDLKNLIIKFLPPLLCSEACQGLLTDLFRLEEDLNNHTLIEEKVLIPKVKQLEKAYLEKST